MRRNHAQIIREWCVSLESRRGIAGLNAAAEISRTAAAAAWRDGVNEEAQSAHGGAARRRLEEYGPARVAAQRKSKPGSKKLATAKHRKLKAAQKIESVQSSKKTQWHIAITGGEEISEMAAARGVGEAASVVAAKRLKRLISAWRLTGVWRNEMKRQYLGEKPISYNDIWRLYRNGQCGGVSAAWLLKREKMKMQMK